MCYGTSSRALLVMLLYSNVSRMLFTGFDSGATLRWDWWDQNGRWGYLGTTRASCQSSHQRIDFGT